MARSKAYLFGGVEIRWSCAPSLITDDTPAEADVPFPRRPEGLSGSHHRGPDARHQGHLRRPRRASEGGHGSVEWAVCWVADEDGFLNSYCNTIPTAEGGTHENGLRSRARQGAARFRRARRQQARRQHHRRRRAGHGRRHALGVHPRARVPGPDQGQARHPGSHPHRRERRARCLRPLAGGQPAAGHQAARLGHRPGRGAAQAQAREGDRPADRHAQAAAARQARRLQPQLQAAAPRSSSSRATRPAARPSRRATARARPCCRCAARSSTSPTPRRRSCRRTSCSRT